MKKIQSLSIVFLLFINLPSFAGYKYLESRFYQVAGTVALGDKNQQILWGKMSGTTSSSNGGWGVSQINFTMSNTDNANVTKAKLWFNIQNSFMGATPMDSLINPSNSLSFKVTGVSNLELVTIYFFLTYDIATSACNANVLDAMLPSNAITIIGNVAGTKSVTSGSNPSLNRKITAPIVATSVSITPSASSIASGGSVVFSPNPTNGGTAPIYSWYVNTILTATTTGAFTLNSISTATSVYCTMLSNAPCASPRSAKSTTKTISITGAKYYQSKFYQVTGSINPGSKNQPILWGQFEGIASNYSGGWGISQLKFNVVNSDNSIVTAAKLYYNTSNDFSTAILKDSIANPSGTITFLISGVSNLGISSCYFFISYDISNGGCPGSTFDASLPSGAITVVGNVAGTKSPVSGSNPTGNRTLFGNVLTPALSITTTNTTICTGAPITFVPVPINGGTNPSYEWFVNNVSVGTTNGPFTTTNLINQSKVYCKMTTDLVCAVPTTTISATKTITVNNNYVPLITISGKTSLYEGATAAYTSTVVNGGNAPSYQWYRNDSVISGAVKATLYADFKSSGDKISCLLTSNKTCASPVTAISNELKINTQKKGRSAAILDLSQMNQEEYQNNLYSAKHIFDVAGIPYVVSSDLNEVQNYPFVLCTSWLDSLTFSAYEDTIISNYVKNGGILIFPRMKNNKLNTIFGITDFTSTTLHYSMSWNKSSNDPSLRWLDDSLEQIISLGRNDYPEIFDTRSYSLSTAIPLAYYDDSTIAICKNHFGNGYAYILGLSLRDLIMRPQLNLDYNAQRTYSNGFEPSSDVFILWIKALYAQHTPNAVWKHTNPMNSKSTIVLTHDVDATSTLLYMHSFADFEDSIGIRTTYFITTHYMHDYFAGDFWNGYESQRQYLKFKHQAIGSHSVGHFPDMEDESIIAIGSPGNTYQNYRPTNNGVVTNGASIYGEVEVSKALLDEELNVDVTAYRPGFLYQHAKQINALEDLGYKYSSSMSANDVLTAFPYLAHKDMAFEGDLSTIYEIPMTISDAQVSDKLDSSNWQKHVSNWLNCTAKNAANGAPSILLIHPNRDYKMWAERSFLSQLPSGTIVRDLDSYGDYWKMRNQVSFSSSLIDSSTLRIIISSINLPLNTNFSLVIDNGQSLSEIRVEDEYGNQIEMEQDQWIENGIILYSGELEDDEERKMNPSIQSSFDSKDSIDAAVLNFICYPNPLNQETTFSYQLLNAAQVKLEIYSSIGEKVSDLFDARQLPGVYSIKFKPKNLAPGIYFYRLKINNLSTAGKLIIQN